MREQAQGRLEMLDERIDRLTEQLHEARRRSYFYTWRTALCLHVRMHVWERRQCRQLWWWARDHLTIVPSIAVILLTPRPLTGGGENTPRHVSRVTPPAHHVSRVTSPRHVSQAVEENMALRERLADVIDAEPDRNFNDGWKRSEGRYLRG